jgi:signal transduction histidine kinase
MTAMSKLPTQFAPAERATIENLEQATQHFTRVSPYFEIIDSVPDIVLILNKERQTVFCNLAAQKFLQKDDRSALYGMRPGEVLNCSHAFETEGGCGTTKFCSTCGAVKAILASQTGNAAVEECRILQKETGNALDLRVWTYPLSIKEEQFTIITAVDISSEKRKEVLERMFFHDILNTLGGLRGMAEMIREVDESERKNIEDYIYRLSETLIEEIRSQRLLLAAENNELLSTPAVLDSRHIMDMVIDTYIHHTASKDKSIIVSSESHNITFESDQTLVSRVVGNMVKNALEASGTGSIITIGSIRYQENVRFWVHNPGVMADEVQLQIFQRSFSTKGPGRGVGTYGIKYLSEKYLNGRVWFTSTEGEGTTFYAEYPLKNN